MAENKTEFNGASTTAHIDAIGDPKRRADCQSLARLMQKVTGERPGFDPRMNDFPFEFTFLQAPLLGTRLEVDSVSQDILSVARSAAFTVDLTRNGAPVGAAATFSGIPNQSDLGSIHWLQSIVSLQGSAKKDEVWTVTLDHTPFSFIVGQGQVADVLRHQIHDGTYA